MTVGAPVTATDDITNALNYTLSGAGADNNKFEIDQKTGQIKTLWDLNRDVTTPATADMAGNCEAANMCVVTVTATDSAGGAPATPVTVNITLKDVEEKPAFGPEDASATPPENVMRVEVAENATGTALDLATYTATDPEGSQVGLSLIGADYGLFKLSANDRLSFRMLPDFETPADANGDNVYEVTVRASDGASYEDRMVTVSVTNANEAPMIAELSGTIKYPENGESTVVTLMATDPERDTITWSRTGGAQANEFDTDVSDGILKFASPPDFEDGQGTGTGSNTYEVIVQASDGANNATITVNVEVTNIDEAGKVTWTVDHDYNGTTHVADEPKLLQFQVGANLMATVTDGDTSSTNAISIPTWQWYRSGSRASLGTPITGETDADYTVQAGDLRRYIHARAFYRIGGNREESATLASDYPVLAEQASNDAPEFDPDEVEREVYEGEKGMTVGAPVTATDDITNALNYTLSGAGADNNKFEIDQKTGQIKTLWDLNRDVTTPATADMAGNCEAANMCVVTVTATDSAGGAPATPVTVNITLKGMDEEPTFTDGMTNN